MYPATSFGLLSGLCFSQRMTKMIPASASQAILPAATRSPSAVSHERGGNPVHIDTISIGYRTIPVRFESGPVMRNA